MQIELLYLIPLGFLLGLVIFGTSLLRKEELFPYKKNTYLLTKAEFKFYCVLLAVLPAEYIIMCKVRLADLVSVKNTSQRQKYFNKIKSKHIDFVICSSELLPVLFIELDDRSHMKKSRIGRDKFLDGLFKSVNAPLLRVAVRANYPKDEITSLLAPHLNNISQ